MQTDAVRQVPLIYTVVVAFGMGKILKVSGLASDILLLGSIAFAILVAFISLVAIEKPARKAITNLALGRLATDPAPSTP